MDLNIPELINSAKEASTFASAKYSNFPVGAALLSKNGIVTLGCNVESSSYGLSICAERVALTKAISNGIKEFDTIAVYAKNANFCSPCGACRQLLYDYAPELTIILTDGKNHKSYPIKDLLPFAFEDSQLK